MVNSRCLLALSSNSNELTIIGGSDDAVTIQGATRQGSDGLGNDIYSLGSEGTIIIDDDINVTT